MRFCHPYFDTAITTGGDKINTVTIENSFVFSELLRDISSSIEGNTEKSMLFDGEKSLSFQSCAELLSSFFPFDMNKKTLLNKIASALEKDALSPEKYNESMKIVAETEAFLSSLSESFDCNLLFTKISPGSIIKASGLEIVDDYNSLAEKILDYFEIVREFEKDKIFFTVNLRSFFSDKEADEFFRSVVMHGFSVVMFENKDYPKSKCEKRLIIDSDLCIIT